MATGYETPEQILERYQGIIGVDIDVTPPIPMTGVLGWTGSAWEKVSSDGSGHLSFTLDAPNSVISGQTTVTNAGTRVALGGSTSILGVTIKAKLINTGYIYVGNNAVTSANGYILSAGDIVNIDVDNLVDIFIDSSVSGEGVSYLAVVA